MEDVLRSFNSPASAESSHSNMRHLAPPVVFCFVLTGRLDACPHTFVTVKICAKAQQKQKVKKTEETSA